ncbi:MAG TPA: acyltransferase domain-containing protein, partial [Catenuloplanes sp.]
AGRAPARPVALLLPGQGSQYAGMATGLYGHEPAFTAAVDDVLRHMGPDGQRVRDDWLGITSTVDVDDVRRAQPLLFAVDYGLVRMLESWGVRPVAMLGHSAGELVAATLAGVFTLRDAVRAQLDRVRFTAGVPTGGMLAVAATAEQVRPYLTGDVAIAAVNASRQTMLAGTTGWLAQVRSRLTGAGMTVAVVPASSPFHSPAMAVVARRTEPGLAAMSLRPPERTMYSGYTGELLGAADATTPRFWARQVTDTVHFAAALDRLLGARDVLLVEAGPGQTLTSFARRHPAVRRGTSDAVALLPRGAAGDPGTVVAAAARIWAEGHDLHLPGVAGLARCAAAAR